MVFDRLTQTLERDFFVYLLDLEARKAVRYLYFFSLLIIQADQDLAPAAEERNAVLVRTLAQLIRDEVRGTDILGRIENDKFFLILHQSDLQSSYAIGERIRVRLENYSFMMDGKEERKTISVGGACFPTNANDVESLIEKADRMVSKARSAGGNRIMLPEMIV